MGGGGVRAVMGNLKNRAGQVSSPSNHLPFGFPHYIGSKQEADIASAQAQYHAIIIHIRLGASQKCCLWIEHLHGDTITQINLLVNTSYGLLNTFFLDKSQPLIV